MNHEPVLLHEVVTGLDLQPGLTVLDGTLGSGEHARAISEKIGRDGLLIGFDVDPEAISRAERNLANLPCRTIFRTGNFRATGSHLNTLGINNVDRAFLDLGLSSLQLADPIRGFSFQGDGPLLMTLNGKNEGGLNAARLVNELSAPQLTDLLTRYGEESHARRIAEALVAARHATPILTTYQLVSVIERAVPKGYHFTRKHFATKTFQALRIATNDELGALTDGLLDIWSILTLGGRLAVISFHSLEARIVKRQFQNWARLGEGQILTKHAIRPKRGEELRNPRSRSATLRIISKIK